MLDASKVRIRPTIGLLVDIFRGYAEQFWIDVAQHCASRGMNLIVMPLELGINDITTEHYNRMIFECIQDCTLDGLIVLANTMAIYPRYNELKSKLEKILKIPVVAVGSHLEPFPSVLIDNASGFAKLVEHLILEHHCTKIAYINGVAEHEDAKERLRVFREIMHKHNLPIEPEWIYQGDFNFSSGQAAVQYFLDAGIRVDAIAAANDKMAMGVIQELQEHGMSIPEDIIVTGFDNILENQMSPLLTTVQQPFKELARAAVDTISRMVSGETVDQAQFFPTEFIPQYSCGCTTLDQQYSLTETNVHRFNRMIASLAVENLVTRNMNKMVSALTIQTLMDNIDVELPGMSISDCYIMLFDKSIVLSDSTPHDATVALAFRSGKRVKELEHSRWTFQEVINDQLDREKEKTVVLLPLYYDMEYYGYMVLHNNAISGWFFEAIHRQLCSALKVILMVEQMAKMNAALDDTLVQYDKTNRQLVIAMDEIQKAQAYLVETEKMAALGTLVAGIAHEINTPVGVCISAITHLSDNQKTVKDLYTKNQLRKKDYEEFMDTTQEACAIIEGNLLRAADLIRSFKEVATDQSTDNHRRYILNEYLRQILLSFQPRLKKTKIHVEIVCDVDMELYGNPGEMMQILNNLLVNSLTHAYDEDVEGVITIRAEREKDIFRLIYTDDGKGIPADIIDKIFLPFFTTNRTGGGTGLGLNILYNLVVKKPGGKVVCTSELGKGVHFELEWLEEHEKG